MEMKFGRKPPFAESRTQWAGVVHLQKAGLNGVDEGLHESFVLSKRRKIYYKSSTISLTMISLIYTICSDFHVLLRLLATVKHFYSFSTGSGVPQPAVGAGPDDSHQVT